MCGLFFVTCRSTPGYSTIRTNKTSRPPRDNRTGKRFGSSPAKAATNTMINIQPIEKIETEVNDGLDVHSIFITIQGEGPFVGQPSVFIRLAGCNLQCPRCDTDYTSTRKRMAVHEIYDTVMGFTIRHMPLIVITGGEPMRQQNLGKLVNYLIKRGFRVQIETNGTAWQLDLPILDSHFTIVCSPKTPKLNRLLEENIDYYKYVITADDFDFEDGLPIHALENVAPTRVARPRRNFDKARVYVQPSDLQDPKSNAESLTAAIKSCQQFGYTLCLQVHKIIHME